MTDDELIACAMADRGRRERTHSAECWRYHSACLSLALAKRLANMHTFLRSFLNPEELGMAVPAHVRDDVREVLGMKRVESEARNGN